MAEQAFDPLARNWETYEQDGLAVLQEKEAILAVLEPDAELAAQVAGTYEELEPGHLKCIVLADMFPVASLAHVLVVSRRVTTFETATDVERAMVGDLAHAVVGRMREVLEPQVGFGVAYFGKVPTFHANVVARDEAGHATRWSSADRTQMSLEDRRALAVKLGFGDPLEVPALQNVQAKALRRFVNPG